MNKNTKILLTTSYFKPEQAASNYLWDNLREKLATEGSEMILYTPVPTRGIAKDVRMYYKLNKNEEFYNGMLKVHRFPLMREKKNPLQRTIRYLLCNIKHYFYAIKTKNVSLIFVVSTPPTQGLMATFVKKKLKIPFVYSLQDIFPDSLVGTGMTKRNSWLWRIGREIEDYTYNNADKIIVISEGFKKNIMAKGVPESKIEVIYNWVDENEVIPVERDKNILFERYGLDKYKFYITYNGNIGLTQNMDLLLEVVEMFKDHPFIHFVIMGEGAYKKEVEQKIVSLNLSNITLLPFQPYEEISHVFSLGDVGLVISKENVGQNSVPSKTWSIMSAARPLLVSFDENSELHEILENNKTGIFVKAGDKEALYNAILELYSNPEQRKIMGENGRAFILKNLTRDIGTSKYVEVIKSVINNSKVNYGRK